MKAFTKAQLRNELDRRYGGGYILVGAEKDPMFSGDPGYDLWLHCMGSAMCCLLEHACSKYEPLKVAAKGAVKGRNGFRESLQKALKRIEKEKKAGRLS
jgi:hypothetical protein